MDYYFLGVLLTLLSKGMYVTVYNITPGHSEHFAGAFMSDLHYSYSIQSVIEF